MQIKEKLYKRDIAILRNYGGIKRTITLFNVLRTKGLEVPEDERTCNRGARGTVNAEKLDSSIMRAKRRVFEYAYCNKWPYFFTLTINPKKYDRSDLKTYYKDLSQFFKDYSKKYKIKISYIFIPELHKDGSWHMHGFLNGLPENHFYKNENGYMDWLPYKEKFGWISLDKIRDRKKAASYITKYISKNLSDCIKDLNAKMFYNSKGLKTSTVEKIGPLKSDFSKPDFETEWCKIKNYSSNISVQSLLDMFE